MLGVFYVIPQKILLPKPHILDINGVWYSSFWSEGPKPKLEHFGLKFCPPAAPLEVLRYPLRSHGAASRGARCITPQCLRSLWDNPFNTLFLFFFLKIQMWKGSRDNIYSLCISALFSISLYPSPTEAKPAATTPLRLWTLQITVVQISLHKSPQIRISDPPILLFGLESLPLEQLWTEKGNNFWRKKLSVNLILTVMAFWKGGEGKKS